jgi:hypothetical protein
LWEILPDFCSGEEFWKISPNFCVSKKLFINTYYINTNFRFYYIHNFKQQKVTYQNKAPRGVQPHRLEPIV